MTDEEILVVVQAQIQGKRIQRRLASASSAMWIDDERPYWHFESHDYRVAPEPRKPREFWLCGVDNHDRVSVFQINSPLEMQPSDAIRVREVISE